MTTRVRGMPRLVWLFAVGLLAFAGAVALVSANRTCSQATPALAGMAWGELLIGESAAAERSLAVRLAATPAQRAAGMQHLCPETVAGNPMLFLFDQPQFVGFHMNNVHVSLDIAFIGPDWRVSEVVRMEQGGDGAWGSTRMVAALELTAGDAARRGIASGTRLRLSGGGGVSTGPDAAAMDSAD
jgi:uncharacterized protein